MKVLMVGPDRNAHGGISSVISEYFRAGLQDNCELSFLSTTTSGGKLKKAIVFIKALAKMKPLTADCDLVHIHISKNGSFLRKFFFVREAHNQGKKIIIHIHSSQFVEYYNNSSNHVRRMIEKAFGYADQIIVLSDFWKNKLSQIFDGGKMVVIPNGLLMPQEYKKDYCNKNILFLGKICQEKGAFDLLYAMKGVVDKFPDAHLFLCGQGETEWCLEECKQLDISRNVSLTGWVSGEAKDNLLKESSIFVLPSYFEAMPVSLIEAMAYGCACIVTPVGAVPEINSNDDIVMTEPGDVTQLSKRICELLGNVELRERIGVSAEQSVRKRYDERTIVRTLVGLYEQVLSTEDCEGYIFRK